MSAKQAAKPVQLSDTELEEQLDAILAEIQQQFPDLEQVATAAPKPQPAAEDSQEELVSPLDEQAATVDQSAEEPDQPGDLEESFQTVQTLLAMAEEAPPSAAPASPPEEPNPSGLAAATAQPSAPAEPTVSPMGQAPDTSSAGEEQVADAAQPTPTGKLASASTAKDSAAAPAAVSENLDEAIKQLDADLARQVEESLDEEFEAVALEQIVGQDRASSSSPLAAVAESATAQDVARELDEQASSPVSTAQPVATAPSESPAAPMPSAEPATSPPQTPPSASAAADHAPLTLSLFGGALAAGKKAKTSTSTPVQPRLRYGSLRRFLVLLNQPFADVPANVRLAAGVIGLTNLVIGMVMIVWALVALVLR